MAQVDRPGTFMLTPATPGQVENDEQAEVVKRFGQQLQKEGSDGRFMESDLMLKALHRKQRWHYRQLRRRLWSPAHAR